MGDRSAGGHCAELCKRQRRVSEASGDDDTAREICAAMAPVFVSGEPVSESACERCLLLLQLSYREVIYVEPFMALKSNQ